MRFTAKIKQISSKHQSLLFYIIGNLMQNMQDSGTVSRQTSSNGYCFRLLYQK